MGKKKGKGYEAVDKDGAKSGMGDRMKEAFFSTHKPNAKIDPNQNPALEREYAETRDRMAGELGPEEAKFDQEKFFKAVAQGDTKGVDACLKDIGARERSNIVNNLKNNTGRTAIVAAIYNENGSTEQQIQMIDKLVSSYKAKVTSAHIETAKGVTGLGEEDAVDDEAVRYLTKLHAGKAGKEERHFNRFRLMAGTETQKDEEQVPSQPSPNTQKGG